MSTGRVLEKLMNPSTNIVEPTVNRQIIAMAWPAVATNITTPLLSLVDMAIVGHFGGGAMIGAVALGGTLFNVVYWAFAFLRMGTSGMTAQGYGAGDVAAVRTVLRRGLGVAVAGGVAVLALAALLAKPILGLVGAEAEVMAPAMTYFLTAVVGAPAVLTTFTVTGWLLGMQRPRTIMWIALATNILNIVLSMLFVYVFDLGIRGVAAGTAVSQWVGALIGILVVRSTYVDFRRRVCGTVTKVAVTWRRFFRVNSDIFLRTLCLAAVTVWFTRTGASLNSDILAANALLLQLFLVFSYFMDGFAFGGEALAGRYYGAGDEERVRRIITALFRWGAGTAVVFTLIYGLFGRAFLGILTDDIAVSRTATRYMGWAVAVPFAGFAAFVWDGVFIGLTRTRALLGSMATAMVVFFVICGAAMAVGMETMKANHGLWLAFIVYLGVRGVVSWIIYRRTRL